MYGVLCRIVEDWFSGGGGEGQEEMETEMIFSELCCG